MNSQTERDVAEKEEARLMRSLQRIGLGTRAPAIKMARPVVEEEIVMATVITEGSKKVPAWKMKQEEERRAREQKEADERAAKERVIKRAMEKNSSSGSNSNSDVSPSISRSVTEDDLRIIEENSQKIETEVPHLPPAVVQKWVEILPIEQAPVSLPSPVVERQAEVHPPIITTVTAVAEKTHSVPPPIVETLPPPIVQTVVAPREVTVSDAKFEEKIVEKRGSMNLQKAEETREPTVEIAKVEVQRNSQRMETAVPTNIAADIQQQELRRALSVQNPGDVPELSDITRVESIVRHTNQLRGRPVVDPVMDELIGLTVFHCRQVLSTLGTDPANFVRFQFEETSKQMVRSMVAKLTQVEMDDDQRRGIVIALKQFTTVGYTFLQNYNSHMPQANYDHTIQQVRKEIRNLLSHFKSLRGEMDAQPKAVLSRSLHKVSCMASDLVSVLQSSSISYDKSDYALRVQDYISFLRSSVVPFMSKEQQNVMIDHCRDLLVAGIEMNQNDGNVEKRGNVIHHLLSSLRAIESM